MIRRALLVSSLLFASQPCIWSAEYSRYAIDSASISVLGTNTRTLSLGGKDFSGFDVEDNPVASSYAVAPFGFRPHDFGLSEATSIESATLSLTNELSALADSGGVEIFFVPDSRDDLGVDTVDSNSECWVAPEACYTLTYDAAEPGGIVAGQFSMAPQLLGSVELDWSETERLTNSTELDLNDGVKAALLDRINAGQEFHLVFAGTSDDGFVEIGSFDAGFDNGPGAAIRPQLTLDVEGMSAGVTKDLVRQGAIHSDGDRVVSDFYGSGNDDNFSEFGIASWSFAAADFGSEPTLADIGSVALTLTHSERNFTDGDMVEFFLVPHTAEELGYDEGLGYTSLTYDSTLGNGVNPEQFPEAPISLGLHPFTPRAGGVRDTFSLELNEAAKTALLESINAGEDFQLLITAPDPTFDITYSGLNNGFDPGNPQLTISLQAAPVAGGCVIPADGIAGDIDGDGTVAFADFLIVSANFGTAVAAYTDGDLDCDGEVQFADFLTLSSNFGLSAGDVQAAVPEPESWFVLICGSLLVGSARRRATRSAR